MGWLRKPKTMNEQRQNTDVNVRAARAPWNLPDAWDDFIKRGVKAWKAYRKTQYRPKAE